MVSKTDLKNKFDLGSDENFHLLQGLVSIRLGDFEKGLNNYFKALKIGKKKNNRYFAR